MRFRETIRLSVLAALAALAASCAHRHVAGDPTAKIDSHESTSAAGWARDFNVDKGNFSSTGRNPYFILEPGFWLNLAGNEDAAPVQLIVTVTNQTEHIDGVDTRVVEERESANNQLAEVSRNYFAIDRTTGDIYYFGEDVDSYRDGKVVNHEGSWRSGSDGAHYGLFMPGKPSVGQKFYQEIAPERAMDRSEIKSMSEQVTLPTGKFQNCLKTQETTPLEPNSSEYKVYAAGIGVVVDGGLKLVNYSLEQK